MCCEISVTIKNEEKTLTTKTLTYDIVTAREDDPTIMQCIEDAIKNFDSEPDDITVRIKLEIQ